MSERVYISGPVSGLPLDEVRATFAARERALVHAGYKVVNPLEKALKTLGEGKAWEEYMAFDVLLLLGCDLINFLQGWEDSRGSRLEAAIAKQKGIGTLFYTGMRYEQN